MLSWEAIDCSCLFKSSNYTREYKSVHGPVIPRSHHAAAASFSRPLAPPYGVSHPACRLERVRAYQEGHPDTPEADAHPQGEPAHLAPRREQAGSDPAVYQETVQGYR